MKINGTPSLLAGANTGSALDNDFVAAVPETDVFTLAAKIVRKSVFSGASIIVLALVNAFSAVNKITIASLGTGMDAAIKTTWNGLSSQTGVLLGGFTMQPDDENVFRARGVFEAMTVASPITNDPRYILNGVVLPRIVREFAGSIAGETVETRPREFTSLQLVEALQKEFENTSAASAGVFANRRIVFLISEERKTVEYAVIPAASAVEFGTVESIVLDEAENQPVVQLAVTTESAPEASGSSYEFVNK